MNTVRLRLDGKSIELEATANTSLLRALRDAGHTRAQGACEQGECGSCLVRIDGVAQNSCLVPVAICEESNVETVASLLNQDLADAFARHGAVQCGFCTPGFVVAAEAALVSAESLTYDSVRERLAGNICRCTGYHGIIEAVLEVGQLRREARR
jgi:aerobic-type carbon monoxide dehydrogenase small subunit (CoxS/CutS family)